LKIVSERNRRLLSAEVHLGLAFTPAPSVSAIISPSNPSPGWNATVEYGKLGLAGQMGYSFEEDKMYWGGGLGTPGLTFGVPYVLEIDRW